MKLKFLLLGLFALPVFAESVYVWTDAKGVMHFSDKASDSQNSVKTSIESNPGIQNTDSAQPAPSSTGTSQSQSQVQAEYTVSISSPSAGATIRNGMGDVEVSIETSPALDNPTQYQLNVLLDGNSQTCDTTSMSCSLTNVYRGAHTLQAQLLDQNGKILASSQGITVFVFRPISKS